MSLNNKTIKILALVAKVVIVFCAFIFIYIEVFKNEEIDSIIEYFNRVRQNSSSLTLFTIALLLMPINWILESFKWRFLLKKIESISISRSVQAVLSGVTISAVLPNRTGEFVGKIAYVNKADRIQAALISVLGSISQLTTTIVLGSFALIYLLLNDVFQMATIVKISGCTILISISILCLIFYFNSSVIFSIIKRSQYLNKYSKYAKIFSSYSRKELGKVLRISFSRYVVFTTQFLLLLIAFEVEIPLLKSLMAIATSFFVISTIPAPALAEIGIRESTSLFFIGLFTDNNIGIVSAAFSLWMINIALPALTGTLFVLRARFIRS